VLLIPMQDRWQILEHCAHSDMPGMRLCFGEEGSDVWVPGRHVLAVFSVGSDWLVFADHDSPYEEGLEICLVSQWQIVDQASLGHAGWASAGIVPERLESRVFGFEFPSQRHWKLEVGTLPALVRPRQGVDRCGRWRSRLWLSNVSGP
jgi:hypothetical protein